MGENNAKNRLLEYNDIMKENDNIYRGLAKNMGLSLCSFWILYMLRTEDTEPVQSAICACLYEPKQTVNSALKKMETEGYIELIPGDDRRSKKILLTQKGAGLCEKTVDRVIKLELQALMGLTEEEQEAFIGLFRKYTGLLKQMKEEVI